MTKKITTSKRLALSSKNESSVRAASPAKNKSEGEVGTAEATVKTITAARKKRTVTKPPAAFPIVAVGASAGGLEAFIELLNALPANTGMCFVFIQHLSETTKSMLPEILSKATSMPVEAVTSDVPAKTNHVYVIPPNVDLSFSKDFIHVALRSKKPAPHLPIDLFMRSLAEDAKTRAIGVILSGTGSDGTHGLAAIKAEGGITFAQDRDSAKYFDMPRSANASAGVIDFILAPKAIGAELVRITRHPYLKQLAKTAAKLPDVGPDNELNQIFALVRNRGGVDFSFYKPSTIRRRISRRMMLLEIDSLNEYVQILKGDGHEVDALQQDLLISVTNFFRNPEVFEALQKTFLPKLFEDRPADEAVRVWTPGCATGEETYSIAICLLEALGESGAERALQIFGTDVSARAVAKARDGLYPENITADVSQERLRRFFVKARGGYQVSKAVRDLCVFAVQDLVKDPPFSKLDLISCRNVLIYLGAPLQERVFNTLHYSLKSPGLLLLGPSETTGVTSNLFRLENKKSKIYSKRPGASRIAIDIRTHRLPSGPTTWEAALSWEAELESEANRKVLNEYAPAGVIVNEALDVVLFRGQTSPYLQPPAGKPTLSVLKMAHGELVLDLRAVIRGARESMTTVTRKGLELNIDRVRRVINLIASPLTSRQDHCMVLFQDVTPQSPPQQKAVSPQSKRVTSTGDSPALISLREELVHTRRELNAIIHEQESTNEELQTANEEILSSNEELQSTNEELQTAKEELQATNEELTTVNDEMHNRNSELTQLNNDLSNLFGSIDLGIVMLGRDLSIRHFTPSAAKVLNLIPADVGRPLGNIKSDLVLDDLAALVRGVLDSLAVTELEVQDSRGHWFSIRIRPYRTEDNKIDGAVMVLTDIDERRRTLDRLRESEVHFRSLFERAGIGMMLMSLEGRPVESNPAIERMLGYSADELSAMVFTEFSHPEDADANVELYRELISGKREFYQLKKRYYRKDGGLLWANLTVSLIRNAAAEPTHAIGMVEKITSGDETEQSPPAKGRDPG